MYWNYNSFTSTHRIDVSNWQHWKTISPCRLKIIPPAMCPTSLWPILLRKLTRWGQKNMAAIFQTTFSNAFSWMKMCEFLLIKISLKFVPKGQINNITTLVQMMAWCRQGNKLSSESVMVSLLTHICITQPQWLNTSLSKPPLNFNDDLAKLPS